MEILADYHTHTVYSHGKGTIEDNVKVAISKGIKTIGISDHGYKNIAYGVKIDDFKKMREEVDILNEKYKDQIKILLGVECNILDNKGNIDLTENIAQYFDYVMAGYHLFQHLLRGWSICVKITSLKVKVKKPKNIILRQL